MADFQIPQLTLTNSSLANLDWLTAATGPTVPITIGGTNYIYFPESYYRSGITTGQGAIDPFTGQPYAGKFIYSPVFLQDGIEKQFIPVSLGQDLADELTKIQFDKFDGGDPRIQDWITATDSNITKAADFTKGFVMPADAFKSAMANTSIPEMVTGQGPGAFAQMPLADLKEAPTNLVLINGQKSYASPSGFSYTNPTGTFYNYTPSSSSGGFLDDFGLGGITDAIQDLGPIGQIAMAYMTGGLSLPEQFAAMAAYNVAGGAELDDAFLNAALTTGINQGLQGLGGEATTDTGYEGLGSGLGGGEYYDSLGAGVDDIMTSIGDVGQMGGSLPTTDFPIGAGVSDLSNLGVPTTGIYPAEGVPSGIPSWDTAYTKAGGVFDPAWTNVGVPVEDLSKPFVYGNSSTDALTGALVGGAAGAATGQLIEDLLPKPPSGSTTTYQSKPDNPDFSKKFALPVQQIAAPDSFNFELSDIADPYLTEFFNGQAVGAPMFDPSGQYASNLIRSLRAANGNMPTFINPGFTSFQSK